MTTSNRPKTANNKSRKRITAGEVFSNPFCFLGFGFGSGLVPFAPGTFGTLVAIPIYYAMAGLSLPVYGSLVTLLFLLGILICQRCEDSLSISDHSGIVWDEIVGYLITMAAVPYSWQAASLGFLLFRLFDIIKPWPISQLDRTLHGGLGVMLDDALAGVFAASALHWVMAYL
ncbi:MAG: phosphatidylglycerophosphatase A [Methylococcaceae bacterium]|jgi:phosphatidylglycerophosphatase A